MHIKAKFCSSVKHFFIILIKCKIDGISLTGRPGNKLSIIRNMGDTHLFLSTRPQHFFISGIFSVFGRVDHFFRYAPAKFLHVHDIRCFLGAWFIFFAMRPFYTPDFLKRHNFWAHGEILHSIAHFRLGFTYPRQSRGPIKIFTLRPPIYTFHVYTQAKCAL